MLHRLFIVFCVACWLVPDALASDEKKQGNETPYVYTNDDLPAAGATGTIGAVESSELPASDVRVPTYSDFRDKNGHGEGWWRQRAAALELRIHDAQVTAQQLHVEFVKGLVIADPNLPARSREATATLRQLEAERDRLPDDLRDAGGLPGWLRGTGRALLLPAPLPQASPDAQGNVVLWAPVPRAAFYIIEYRCLDCCGAFDTCDVRSLDLGGTSATLPFAADAAVRWRVRALDAAGFPGAWSEWTDPSR